MIRGVCVEVVVNTKGKGGEMLRTGKEIGKGKGKGRWKDEEKGEREGRG